MARRKTVGPSFGGWDETKEQRQSLEQVRAPSWSLISGREKKLAAESRAKANSSRTRGEWLSGCKKVLHGGGDGGREGVDGRR